MFRVRKPNKNPENTNNELHNTILARDEVMCSELISTMSPRQLNQRSLGNTPIMLALKTGLVNIAECLINDEQVLIDISDKRGFSLLHYACFLREDRLIESLLDRDATSYQVDEIYDWPPKSMMLRNSLVKATEPLRLYQDDVFIISPEPEEIIDSDNWHYLPLILTDLLFHMDKLCLNYGLKQADDFTAADEIPSSAIRFATYVKIGLNDLLEMRKAKMLSNELIERLSNVSQQQHLAVSL